MPVIIINNNKTMMKTTEQQQKTIIRFENKGFQYIYKTGDLVLVQKSNKAFYIKKDGTYFAE